MFYTAPRGDLPQPFAHLPRDNAIEMVEQNRHRFPALIGAGAREHLALGGPHVASRHEPWAAGATIIAFEIYADARYGESVAEQPIGLLSHE